MVNQILSVIVILVTLLTGGAKIDSPPKNNNTQENSFMVEYKELIKTNASPKQILSLIRTDIKSLSKNDAEIVLDGYIDALTKKLEVYDYGSGLDLTLKEYRDLKDVQNSFASSSQVNQETKNKLLDAYSEGYRLHRLEDGYNLVVNFEFIKSEFSNYVSDKYASYISIMADTVNGKDTTLFEMPKDLDFITSELIKIENYRNKYKIPDQFKNLTKVYNDYLSAYLIGGKYSYTRDMETNILKPEVLKIYKDNQKQYKGSNLERITTEYINVLEKSKYKFTDEVFAFINKPKE